MCPSKSVQDLEAKSVKKKFKNKKFAAGCSREVIQRGAEMLGWDLDDLIEKTILAISSIRKAYSLLASILFFHFFNLTVETSFIAEVIL